MEKRSLLQHEWVLSTPENETFRDTPLFSPCSLSPKYMYIYPPLACSLHSTCTCTHALPARAAFSSAPLAVTRAACSYSVPPVICPPVRHGKETLEEGLVSVSLLSVLFFRQAAVNNVLCGSSRSCRFLAAACSRSALSFFPVLCSPCPSRCNLCCSGIHLRLC